MTEIWEERLPAESAKAFQAFVLYRGMLPNIRSHESLRQQMGRTRGYLPQIEHWSSLHKWVKRANAYDDYMAKVKVEAQKAAIIEMAERQAKEGFYLQSRGIERLKLLALNEMAARDAIHAVTEGAKLERTARGEPTEIIKGDIIVRPKPLGEYTDEELEQMAKTGRLPTGEEKH